MKPTDHIITDEIDEVLKELTVMPMVFLTKSESTVRHSAINKMEAYNLIEEKSRGTYKLTVEGYDAIKVGGFDKWEKSKNPTTLVKVGKWFLTNIWKITSALLIAYLIYKFGLNKA